LLGPLTTAFTKSVPYFCFAYAHGRFVLSCGAMPNTIDNTTRTTPSALAPTEAELATWHALSRDEQVALYRGYFADPACQTITADTMADGREAARRRLAGRG
jgi:hypothetical protein